MTDELADKALKTVIISVVHPYVQDRGSMSMLRTDMEDIRTDLTPTIRDKKNTMRWKNTGWINNGLENTKEN